MKIEQEKTRKPGPGKGIEAGQSHSLEKSCRIWVGTCGYSYTEWIGSSFYPQGTKSGKMLAFYARKFPVTELNYTWYQMPRSEGVERQRKQVPPGFKFLAKLTRSMTHEVEERSWKSQAAAFRDGISPLTQSGQLMAVLIQLPPYFNYNPKNRGYLAALLSELEGLPLAVEFRHRSWAKDRVFAELERRKVALVSVDEPELDKLFPPLGVVTNPDFFYVRMHGRNTKGWGKGSKQVQFDYNYSEKELLEWTLEKILPMAEQAQEGAVVFNNHVRAQAPANALALAELLLEHGIVLGGE
jgi:uncharacterized protein YecE (DUF72 family)